MSTSIIADFIKSQKALVDGGAAVPAPAAKIVVRPEATHKFVEEPDPEEMFNDIIEKKPNAKKVLKFLQLCIDAIISDDD